MLMNKDIMINDFLPQKGNYRQLRVFQLGNCIFALTYAFAHRHLQVGDRTIDQMIQAARSGKQNIAEGSVDGSTSKEMEIKLTNVAKASMHELLIDYEDFLLTHGMQKWGISDERTQQTRIAITMLHQFDVLISRLIESQKRAFLKEGGIKEQMFKARSSQRSRSSQSPRSFRSSWSSQSSRSSQSSQSSQREDKD
jgi:four helix bundle suffix protein